MAGPVIKEAEVEEERKVMEVADVRVATASPELGARAGKDMRKVREAMYRARSFHNAYF